MRSPRQTLSRRVAPRAVVALSRVSWPARTGAFARRELHRRGRVELYFAFDDPQSAVAVLDLERRLRSRAVTLALRPVLRAGIPGDPAAEHKRHYALLDARRLASARLGLELARGEPLEPGACAFLADWAAPAATDARVRRFCVEALRALWFEPQPRELSPAGYAQLWRAQLGSEPPPAAHGEAAVRRNERAMRLRWMYATPAAWVHGRWYFAHDRPQQICEWLDELGWGEL